MNYWNFFLKLLSIIFPISRNNASSIDIGMLKVEWTDKQREMLRNGYKETFDNEIFPPDTVWAGSHSKVYHYSDCCAGVGIADGEPMPESEALRRGLRRCKKCDWHGTPVPSPGKKPVPKSKPVSKAVVKPVKWK